MTDANMLIATTVVGVALLIVVIVLIYRIVGKVSSIAGNTGALPGIRDDLKGLNGKLNTALREMPKEPPREHPPGTSGAAGTVARGDWGIFDWEGDWMECRVPEEKARATFAVNAERAWTLVKNIRFDGTTGEETYTVVERRESMLGNPTQPLLRTR